MPKGKWGKEIDYNLFTTSDADRTKFAANGCDADSLVGDPQFVDPAKGNYRVRDTSPALKVGFVNFPMDQFGVTSARLKKIARRPELPVLGAQERQGAGRDRRMISWMGAKVRNVSGMGDVSAAGLASESGVLVVEVPEDSVLAKAGLRAGDVILKIDGRNVFSTADLPSGERQTLQQHLDVWRDQRNATLNVSSR